MVAADAIGALPGSPSVLPNLPVGTGDAFLHARFFKKLIN